jgi:four helix bundle protein
METGRKKAKSFRDMEVWTLGMKIVTDIYEVTSTFPREEVYGLVSQMRRAAVSIPSNIAEGFNRYHNKEYRQFIHMAIGSCGELETQIEVAERLGYITTAKREALLEESGEETGSFVMRNPSLVMRDAQYASRFTLHDSRFTSYASRATKKEIMK